ncbi:MAG: hypothetical protein ABIU84_08440 [Thermoanaerobaculia bacterium]
MIGKRPGPYEITVELGEGGMRMVYRATFTKFEPSAAMVTLTST